MAIEAPCSNHKKTNLKIGIIACVLLAVWCTYDGYINKDWIKDHTDANGNPETYLVINRQGPYYLISAAVLMGAYMFVAVRRKVVADENELIIPSTSLRTGNNKQKIAYNSIEKIDKTYFDKKGYFIITYNKDGRQMNRKLSDRDYDNLSAVLDHLVEQIS